jgi:hypothetical protein
MDPTNCEETEAYPIDSPGGMITSESVTKVKVSPPVKLESVVKAVPAGIAVGVSEGGIVRVRRATEGVPRRRIAPRKGPSHSIRMD